MVWSAASVDWTIVKNEIEALQLEFTWIRSESPRFNVVFRDDKSYPYLAVSNKDKYPRLFITRKENKRMLNILVHTRTHGHCVNSTI